MDEIMVVYWSQTGNTEAMAQAVAQGIEEAGKKAKLAEVSAVSAADLKEWELKLSKKMRWNHS